MRAGDVVRLHRDDQLAVVIGIKRADLRKDDKIRFICENGDAINGGRPYIQAYLNRNIFDELKQEEANGALGGGK